MSTQALAGSFAPRALGRLRRVPAVQTAALIVLAVIVIAAIFGPLLAPQDPNKVEILRPFEGASSAHLLGTDSSGRDIFSRLIVGSRTALLGPLIVVSIATAIGLVLAILAAWYGGWVDVGISRLNDLLFAFPGMLLAIVAASVFGVGLSTAAIALSIAYIPYIARVVRAEAIRQRRLPYIEAAWLQGVPTLWIWLRSLIPALWGVLLAQIVTSFAYATIDVAAVSYLGLGVQAPTADWGTMVAEGQDGLIQGHPMETLSAGICLVVMILALGIVGDWLGEQAEKGR